jgi:hypothetical protein
MHWATIDLSKASHTLLTSDRPFITTHGLKDPKSVLLFPLAPDLLFAATNGRAQTGQVIAQKPSFLARHMNDNISGRAVEMVIGKTSPTFPLWSAAFAAPIKRHHPGRR